MAAVPSTKNRPSSGGNPSQHDREDAQAVAVRERARRRRAAEAARSSTRSGARPRPHRRGSPPGDAGPDGPAGALLADVGCGPSLVVAVVPLAKVVVDLDMVSPSRPAGTSRAHAGAGTTARARTACPSSTRPSARACSRPRCGERHVGAARVPTRRRPLRRAVADEPQLAQARRVTVRVRARTRLRGAARSPRPGPRSSACTGGRGRGR